jgi:aspartate aminotransferase-like enzyme
MITLVRVPEGIDEMAVRRRLLDEYGIEIMAAFGRLLGKVWRIGLMGYNARLENVLTVLAALEQVLAGHAFDAPPRAGVRAALERWEGP